ncbi:hypothetical protein [Nannocystis punicea]|uniref:Uncharacterized protein n=1 Tax=Nannocystis punicea TaxID=2995304 RepID=A0ABY7GWU1_9BACT|nr:hypothetical protein [Nannocystis poenicansa]WAS91413.1 hypothetical protein O0S08_34950 [Nannocystis poenicansa]
MPKDMHPEEYGDLMVEALRMAVVGPDEVILGFQVWDMDDFDNELSLLFRANGFAETERLAGIKDLVRDLSFVDGDLFVVTDKEVHRFAGGNIKKRTAMKLPIAAARAIGGRSTKELYVVGEGVARFDGKKWTKLASKAVELTCLSVYGDVAYAGGKDGTIVQISGDQVKPMKATKVGDIGSILIDSRGVLSVAGHRGSLQGPPDRLAAMKLAKDVSHAGSVCEFKGKIYWGCVGDDDGMGLFVQNGKKLERVSPEMCLGMIATERYLYAGGETLVLRYDGDEFMALNLDYDEDEEQWVLDLAEDEDA